MRRIVSIAPALVVLLVAIVALAAAPTAIRAVQTAQTQVTVSLAQQRLDQEDVLKRLSDSVADIADAVGPSVVHIDGFSANSRRGPMSSGAGWVFDDKGHIVTNAHVVRGSDVITVQFADGHTVEAKFIGADNPTDVGVIRVSESAGLVPMRRATGERVRQGDRVYAFGSPFGFRFSMSEGIISATGRNARGVTGSNGYTNFLQTDAAVNPGNSGGPLVDVYGRVVGMNTAIVSADNPSARTDRQGQSAGIGFAIPLETIESVAGQIIERGVVVKGFLGVALGETGRLAPSDLPEGFRGSGVIVSGVTEDLAAARAGLRQGDIILTVNGERVTDIAVLRARIASRAAGETVTMRVVRAGDDGKPIQIEIPVVLGAAVVDASGELRPVPHGVDPVEYLASFDSELRRVDRTLRSLARAGVRDFSVRENDEGMPELTCIVAPNSGAWQAGLRDTDVVVSVAGQVIAQPTEFVERIATALSASPRVRLPLQVRGVDGEVRTVTLSLERQ
ncbi:MAG: trypsin-like peptidase domain-containing protein [Phycisphaeraceae bacterium]|nr:trypsin-like peptidase domain-containing protein [Phycisphaeraceae bacterium]